MCSCLFVCLMDVKIHFTWFLYNVSSWTLKWHKCCGQLQASLMHKAFLAHPKPWKRYHVDSEITRGWRSASQPGHMPSQESIPVQVWTVLCGEVQQHLMWSNLRPALCLTVPYSIFINQTYFYTEICANTHGAVSRPAGKSTFSWFLSERTGGWPVSCPTGQGWSLSCPPPLLRSFFQSNCLKNVVKRRGGICF